MTVSVIETKLQGLEEIVRWTSSNRLRLNTDRTQFMWLRTKHHTTNLETVSLPAAMAVTSSHIRGPMLLQFVNKQT